MCTSSVPRSKIVTDTRRVSDFCARILKAKGWLEHTAIGLERDGELVAGVVYENYTGPNIYLNVAAVPGRRWLTRTFLNAVFHYPFVRLGVQRITGMVEACNSDALRLNKHLGFEREAVLRGVMPTGDLIIVVMWKERCRFIGERHG